MSNIMETIKYISILIHLINSMGFVGNVFSLIAFSQKAFAKSSIRFYGRVLAFFDSFVVFRMAFMTFSIFKGVDLINQNITACKLVSMSQLMLAPISGWILIALSIDYLNFQRFRLPFIKTKFFQYGFILGVFLLHILTYSTASFEIYAQNLTDSNNLTTQVTQCRLNTRSIIPSIFVFEPNLIPYLIIILLTPLMAIMFRGKFEQVATDPNEVESNNSGKQWRFNSFLLNVVFIFLVSPLIGLLVIPNLDDFYENQLRQSIVFALWNLNFALHFWVHFAANSVFRNEMLISFRLRQREDA